MGSLMVIAFLPYLQSHICSSCLSPPIGWTRGGLPIGNVAAGTELMIERYLYAKDQSEEATYGWSERK